MVVPVTAVVFLDNNSTKKGKKQKIDDDDKNDQDHDRTDEI